MKETPPAIPAWDDAFAVGVPELDAQHRGLFLVLAGLSVALDDGEEAARAGVEELLRDCVAHFADEEDFLGRVGYPETLKQRIQHRLFVERLIALARRVRYGEERFGGEALDSLASWLRGHVLGLDREYAAWLRERGG